MQALIAGAVAFNWSERATQAWGWAQAQATDGWALVLALPSSCKLATMHAGMVCLGQHPEYVATPGFAPLRHSWGWLLLGIVSGSVVSVLI